jgi:hypothetical protein
LKADWTQPILLLLPSLLGHRLLPLPLLLLLSLAGLLLRGRL